MREEALGDLQNQYAEWLTNQEIPAISAPVTISQPGLCGISRCDRFCITWFGWGLGAKRHVRNTGYTGGALLGATSGWLIANQEHPTLAQATLMASSTGWGARYKSNGSRWF